MQRLGYDSEDEPFDRFLRGEPDDYEWLSDRLRFVREVTLAGATVQRVRIVSLPHADYTQMGVRGRAAQHRGRRGHPVPSAALGE